MTLDRWLLLLLAALRVVLALAGWDAWQQAPATVEQAHAGRRVHPCVRDARQVTWRRICG